MEKNAKKNEEKNIDREDLRKLIDIAAGRVPADLVIKNCRGGKVSGRKTAGTLYHDRCDRSVNRNKIFLGAYTKCI